MCTAEVRLGGFVAIPLAIRESIDYRTLRRTDNSEQYEDKQYIKALQLLQEDERVKLLGLCNVDTERVLEILQADIKIVSNQVQARPESKETLQRTDKEQFSLIDSRPRVKMAEVCQQHDVKLLTYGTLVNLRKLTYFAHGLLMAV